MYRVTLSAMILVSLLATCRTLAQDNPSTATATCNFDEDHSLAVEYQRVSVNLKRSLSGQVPFGRVWAPGGKPMTLFTNVPVQIGAANLGLGAYTMFVIPGSKQWTLIISKSTDTSGAYDEAQDLARVPMDSGELPIPEADLNVSFGHIAPDQCSIRVDLEKYGHFAVFQKK